MAPIGNTSWVCDPKWVSYALEQAERLLSHTRAKKVVHIFALNPLYSLLKESVAYKTFQIKPDFLFSYQDWLQWFIEENIEKVEESIELE